MSVARLNLSNDLSLSQTAQAVLSHLHTLGVDIRGVSDDSRTVQPGDLFLAWPGGHSDGRDYIARAVAHGAVAVLWQDSADFIATSLPVPGFGLADLPHLAGELAHLIYAEPSQALWVAGVTGTNGKTTVSQWLAAALSADGVRCGVIGTLGIGFPGELQVSANTTPGAVTLQANLANMRERGAQAVAMEVSSIGLAEGRVNGVAFDVALFTNLTHDHLDYHGSMEAYGTAKAHLFTRASLKRAVINLDDAFGRGLAQQVASAGCPVIAYTQAAEAAEAELGMQVLRAGAVEVTSTGQRFEVSWGDQCLDVQLRAFGAFNISNALAVLGALLSRGVSLAQAITRVEQLLPPPGRMESLGGLRQPLVVVDYAHTPDALNQVLQAMRPAAQTRGGRLVCVFGCGGDRDARKRPLMAQAAAAHADQLIITSDNPRSEAPEAIIEQIWQGVPPSAHPKAVRECDRAHAIACAIGQADEADVIVLAGKGHETYQEVAGVRSAFSDWEHAQRALDTWQSLREAQR